MFFLNIFQLLNWFVLMHLVLPLNPLCSFKPQTDTYENFHQ